MPRNGSGSYTLPTPPTPFVNGTVANAPDVNTVNNDIASALTDSVAADGQTPMTGALNMNNQNITGANNLSAKSITLNSSVLPLVLRGYIGGLTLSNDGVTPNTVLDVAAGACTDSANATFIQLTSAFTKTTSGAWTAGTGNAGMGTGLTIAANTWYHVFIITNAGVSDIYFDTSVTAANAPANTTASRRIGSFNTDASAHIVMFTQQGDEFLFADPGLFQTDATLGTAAKTYTCAQLPPGVSVQARVRAQVTNSSASAAFCFYSPYESAPQGFNVICPSAGTGEAEFLIRTNTVQAIVGRSSQAANNTINLYCVGWIDSRGRFA